MSALAVCRRSRRPCMTSHRSGAKTKDQALMLSHLQGGAPGGGCCSLGTLLVPGSSPGTVILPGSRAAYRT